MVARSVTRQDLPKVVPGCERNFLAADWRTTPSCAEWSTVALLTYTWCSRTEQESKAYLLASLLKQSLTLIKEEA